MIAIDPGSRPTFDQLLHTTRGTLFPESFYSLIHDFVSSINDISSTPLFTNASNPSLPSALTSALSQTKSVADDKASVSEAAPPEILPLPDDSDRRMTRLWAEFEMVEPTLKGTSVVGGSSVKIDYAPQYSSFKPLQVGWPDLLFKSLSILIRSRAFSLSLSVCRARRRATSHPVILQLKVVNYSKA